MEAHTKASGAATVPARDIPAEPAGSRAQGSPTAAPKDTKMRPSPKPVKRSARDVVEAANHAFLGRRVGRILLLRPLRLGLARFLVRLLLAFCHGQFLIPGAMPSPEPNHFARRGQGQARPPEKVLRPERLAQPRFRRAGWPGRGLPECLSRGGPPAQRRATESRPARRAARPSTTSAQPRPPQPFVRAGRRRRHVAAVS